MALRQIFDPAFTVFGWFDSTTKVEGWFDQQFSAATSSPIIGTLSVVEADDVLVSTASVLITGTLSVTEAVDVLSSAGAVLISGALSVAEADDTLSATGSVAVAGSLTVTETDDTLSSAGIALVSGNLSVIESNDALSATGGPIVAGTLSIAETDDVLLAAAAIVLNPLDVRGYPTSSQDWNLMSALGYSATETLYYDQANTEQFYVLAKPPEVIRMTLFSIPSNVAAKWLRVPGRVVLYNPFFRAVF